LQISISVNKKKSKTKTSCETKSARFNQMPNGNHIILTFSPV
jgi:hypothetical protein